MNAETETAIQNLSKAFADAAELISVMNRIAKSLANIELHLQAKHAMGGGMRRPHRKRHLLGLEFRRRGRAGGFRGAVRKSKFSGHEGSQEPGVRRTPGTANSRQARRRSRAWSLLSS